MGKTSGTPESRALAAAFKGKPRGFVSTVARQVGVEPNNISHWIHGRRPVPAVYARPLGVALGIDPATVSAAFAAVDLGSNVATLPGEPVLRPELVDSRQVNNITALRLAVAALVTSMQTHRPAEAAEFARLLRSYAPPKFHNQGLVGELLASVESRAAPKVKAPVASRPRSKP